MYVNVQKSNNEKHPIKIFLLKALGIEHSKIHISETATDKVPNTSPTAASVGSDLNGMAVLNACTTIKSRLQPFIAANPKGPLLCKHTLIVLYIFCYILLIR